MPAPATRIAPWEDFVLRLIAVYKLLHAVFFTAVGFGLLRLKHRNVVEILNTYVIIPYHLPPENRVVDWVLDKAEMLAPHLVLLGWAAFFYAALFAAEGIGLYMRKRWAEYLVVIVTGSLLPVEVYELFVRLAWWKFGVVLGNVLIVTYLIHRLLLDARFKAPQREANDHDKGAPPSPTHPSGPANDRESSEDEEKPSQPPATPRRVITQVPQ
jgi:uncharacterized membrane protein (DUF2068 family)